MRVGVQRKGDEITVIHQPTCLLGFLGLQILRRLQGLRERADSKRCLECKAKFRPERSIQKYCNRCIKGER